MSGALRLAATTILSAAVALPLVGEEPPAPTPTPTPEAAASAAPAAKPWYEEISVNGFLSVWYEYNTNRPASGRNQYRVFDYLDNSVNVDAAEIVIQKAVEKPGDVGFRLVAVAGAVARVASAAGLFQGQDFDLQQATVSWIAPVGSGLRLDFGKFVTHMGNEVIEGYDGWNDNATRSFVFGFAIPFTHTGLKATSSFGDQLTAMLVLCNGWDVVQDNNSGKSVGAQLIWTPSKALTFTGNYMGGPEQPDTTSNWRNVGNLVAQWKAIRPDRLHPRAHLRRRAERRDDRRDRHLERPRRLRPLRPDRLLRPRPPRRVLRRPRRRPHRRPAVPQGGHR